MRVSVAPASFSRPLEVNVLNHDLQMTSAAAAAVADVFKQTVLVKKMNRASNLPLESIARCCTARPTSSLQVPTWIQATTKKTLRQISVSSKHKAVMSNPAEC